MVHIGVSTRRDGVKDPYAYGAMQLYIINILMGPAVQTVGRSQSRTKTTKFEYLTKQSGHGVRTGLISTR